MLPPLKTPFRFTTSPFILSRTPSCPPHHASDCRPLPGAQSAHLTPACCLCHCSPLALGRLLMCRKCSSQSPTWPFSFLPVLPHLSLLPVIPKCLTFPVNPQLLNLALSSMTLPISWRRWKPSLGISLNELFAAKTTVDTYLRSHPFFHLLPVLLEEAFVSGAAPSPVLCIPSFPSSGTLLCCPLLRG